MTFDTLEEIRAFQESAKPRGYGNFSEWYQDHALRKSPSFGGRQSPLNPGVGLMGHLNTDSRAPAGPPASRRNGGNLEPFFGTRAFNPAKTNSQYAQPVDQPPPYIDDVDMASVWYSPFQPVWPFGPPYINRPRDWNYQVGYNMQFIQPRMELYGMLRGMRSSWGVLSTLIETRKDQLMRLPYTIQRKDKPRGTSKAVAAANKFFKKPDQQFTYGQWARLLLDDLLVIDAPSIYKHRNLGGHLIRAERVDGATIFPLIDDAGRRPESVWTVGEDGIQYSKRQPAFQQIIYGLPMVNMSEDELTYAMMRPRPDLPVFGYCFSPDTEILTIDGWKNITEVTAADELATRNTNHLIEYHRPKALVQRPFAGELVHLHGKCLDLLVTPEHRILLAKRSRLSDSGMVEFVKTAEQIVSSKGSEWRIPLTAQWENSGWSREIETKVFGGAIERQRHIEERNKEIVTLHEAGNTQQVIGNVVGLTQTAISHILQGKHNYDAPANWQEDIELSGDDYCALMGMWLSEGHCHQDGIHISQNRRGTSFAPFNDALVKAFGSKVRYETRGDGGTFVISSRALRDHFRQFGHSHEKFVPDDIMKAPPRQIEIFWHYYWLGDGFADSDRIATTSRRMADQLVELAMKRGFSASMSIRAPKDAYIKGRLIKAENCNPLYIVSVRKTEYTDFNVSTVPYVGTTYCVSVPNETVYVRRNGLPCWTMNSPVEQIFNELLEAIRKTFYQLEFWRSGSMPELIVTVPDTWSPRQIAMFQAHFDALLSGQLSLKSKVRFLPGGMKPFDIKNASGESLWSERDEMLIRLACFALSIAPTPFVKQTNRGTAQNAQQVAQEEGLYPLMAYWKDDIMDPLLEAQGFDDIEFVFLPRPEVDLLKQAQIHQIKINSGEMTRDEARVESGEEPYADGIGAVPTVAIGAAVVPLENVISGEAMIPGTPTPAAGAQPADLRDRNAPEQGGARQSPADPAHSTPQPQPRPAPSRAMRKISQGDVDAAAAEADTTPSDPRKKNGNYRKGHLRLHGLSISIENARGSKREEKDALGRKRGAKMPAAYGYIRGTVGADGDQVDVYVGKHPELETVFIIDQDKFDPDGVDKGFDEHKVMLGFKSLKSAAKAYLKSHFDGLGHERCAAITRLSLRELKDWLKNGDMKKPISEQGVGAVVARRGADSLIKIDTISTSTNLLSYPQPKRKRGKKSRRRQLGRDMGPRWLTL